MGYYTYFTVEWKNESPNSPVSDEKIMDKFDKAVGYEDSWGNGFSVEAKWYSYDNDMYAISKQFPTVLFCIHGDGESSDDLWDDYWQNGMRQCCAAVIPPFDRSKMIPYEPRPNPWHDNTVIC